MDQDCIFCKIVEEKSPSKKIYENNNFIAILEITPQVEGHTLIIPKKHYKTILDLPNELGNDLIDFIKKTNSILKEKYNSKGFNIIINTSKEAGQIIDHLHIHILPRKKDDGHSLSLKKK
jgi:histidine triad (HIT) family protein